MKAKAAQFFLVVGIFVLPLLTTQSLRAQGVDATLSGTVTGPTGTVSHAKVSVKNLNTGQTVATQTDAAGAYKVANLAPADYEVTISADGFAARVDKVTLVGGATQTMDAALAAQSPTENLPNAPSSSKTEPSLEDLGFTPEQARGNAQQQALLDKRTHMLKVHQRLGLITTIPLIATLATSINAGGKNTTNTDRTVHMVLGAVTGDLYFMTAYYAIRAPRVDKTKKKGPIRFHEAMAWIHGPGMILTPILGGIAYSQKNNGEKVHGIASAHGPVAIVTAGAFGAALLSVSLKF
jgi:hypothetical protein